MKNLVKNHLVFDSYYKFELDDYENFNREALQNIKYLTLFNNSISVWSGTKIGTFMSQRFNPNEPWLSILKSEVYKFLNNTLSKPFNDSRYYNFVSWVNISTKDDNMNTHNHQRDHDPLQVNMKPLDENPSHTIMSGTYAIRLEDGHGDLLFWSSEELPSIQRIIMNQKTKIKVPYRTGECVCFSPNLNHSTNDNTLESNRITISFNITINPSILPEIEI
tara:strand:- start:3287 stop:3946 length:660 start_codon:yes stop_codon:yes gene_type:complete